MNPATIGEYDRPILGLTGGEGTKSSAQVDAIYEWLIRMGANKADHLVIVGGGTVLDTAAFAAATFQRGIPFTLVPTTLLAMVDAAIGGKNGINLLGLKNYIGTIVSPASIIADLRVLDTLPEAQLLEGWMEMVKHGLIADASYWRLLQSHVDVPGPGDLSPLIHKAAALKLAVVAGDPYENGMRKQLNFGHTVAHALEANSDGMAQPVTHGMAVGLGMLFSLRLSERCCNGRGAALDFESARTSIRNWIERSDAHWTLDWARSLPPEAIWRRMKKDKKNRADRVLEVVLSDLGTASWDYSLEESEFLQTWKESIAF